MCTSIWFKVLSRDYFVHSFFLPNQIVFSPSDHTHIIKKIIFTSFPLLFLLILFFPFFLKKMLSSSPPVTFDLAKYPTVDTIRLLASLLERMTAANDLLNKQQPVYTRFHARLVPSIDIFSYLSRILKYCPCANECFLSLLVYFDRMSKNALALTGKPFTIDSFNIHRLIIAGVMVASKFFSDVFYTNTRYAKVLLNIYIIERYANSQAGWWITSD